MTYSIFDVEFKTEPLGQGYPFVRLTNPSLTVLAKNLNHAVALFRKEKGKKLEILQVKKRYRVDIMPEI